MRVLYVEDNPQDADLTSRALAQSIPAIEVTLAATVTGALDALHTSGPGFDLILSDFHLPDGDALNLLTALPGLRLSLPFVVVTGNGVEDQAISALKAGADDYVIKKTGYLENLPDLLQSAMEHHRTYKHRHERPLQVLYIERNADDVELSLQHMSRYAPFIHFTVARTSQEGLDLLPMRPGGECNFDIILSDFHMPKMNGLDILKEVRQVRHLQIPMVIATGQGDEEIAIQALKLGADDYLVKSGNYLYNLPSILENAFFRVELEREETALRESEQRFRLLAENAQDFIYRLSLYPELKYEYVSPSAACITGYTPEDHYANPRLGFETVHPDDRSKLEGLTRAGVNFQKADTLRVIKKDGSLIWMEHHITPVYDQDNRLIAVEGIGRDVTARRQAAAAVQESELRFRNLFDHSIDAILLIEEDKFIDCNEKAAEIFGCSKAEIIGKSPWNFSPEMQPEGISSMAAVKERIEAVRKGTAQFYEWVHTRLDGSLFDAEVHLNRLVLPEKTLIFAQMRDITEKKKASDALEESEAKMRALVEQVPVVIYTEAHSPERCTIFISQQLKTLFGYTPEQWTSDPEFWKGLIHPDDLDEVLAEDERTHNSGESFKMEYRMARSDGTYKWVADEARLIRDENKKPLLWQGVMKDITERKQAEEELRIKNELLTKFIYHSPIYTFIKEVTPTQSRVLNASENFIDMIGVPGTEMIGKTMEELFPAEFAAKITADDWAVASGGEVLRLDEDLNGRNFTTIKFPITQGGKHLLAGYTIDITERKQAEEKVRESERRYRSIIETAQEGIWSIDDQYCTTFVNAHMTQMLGYTPAEMMGKSVEQFLPQSEIADFHKKMEERKMGRKDKYERGYLHKDGSVRWMLVSSNSIQDDEGHFLGSLGMFADFTERKQAEEEIRQLNTSLEVRVEERTRALADAQEQLVRQEKLAILGKLAGGVGHELRNPLGVIKNAIYYLRMVQPDADEKIIEYLGIIDTETRNADKIINDLLDFSRVKSVDREPMEVGELISMTLKRFPAPEGVTVKKKIPETLPKVHVDPRQLTQVLGNLVLNGCQAMPEGGVLTLSAVHKGKEVAIAVKDSGMGIPPENRSKLFQPLFTTKTRGIGLGLAVSQKLVEANDARIEVQSTPGKGSTFTVHLPIVETSTHE